MTGGRGQGRSRVRGYGRGIEGRAGQGIEDRTVQVGDRGQGRGKFHSSMAGQKSSLFDHFSELEILFCTPFYHKINLLQSSSKCGSARQKEFVL